MVDSACDKYKDELSALLDNQVAPSLKSEIESHLEACHDCAAEFESLKAVSKLLGKAFAVNLGGMADIPSVEQAWAQVQRVLAA